MTRVDPFGSPGALHYDEEEEAAVLRALRSRRLSRYYGNDLSRKQPSELEAWEADFSDYFGGSVKALAVSSGTAALITALAAAGVERDSEVIIPSYSFIALPAAVVILGAKPVVVGIDESLNIDPRAVADAITPKTAAIIAVHMRGSAADMASLRTVATASNVALIEDVAQALGATFDGRLLGTIGDLGCFSLQSRKVITTGEGGVVVTADEGLMERAFTFHDCSGNWRRLAYGGKTEWKYAVAGLNLRYSEILASIARVQLRKAPAVVGQLRRNFSLIAGHVSNSGVDLKFEHDAQGSIGSQLIIRRATPKATAVAASALNVAGIGAAPLHLDDSIDLHIYPCWERYEDHLKLGPGAERSLNLLSHHFEVDIDPTWDLATAKGVARAVVRACKES